jgi:hypothetical protein
MAIVRKKSEPKPVSFEHQNIIWKAPPGMANCGDLPGYRDKSFTISCWKFPFWQRIRFLFTGRIWIWVHLPIQPPISLQVKSPFSGQSEADGE